MNQFRKVFGQTKCAVVGMVHVGALPGTPKYNGSVQEIIDKACKEAQLYAKHKIDGIMLENMHDVPYQKSESFTPETVATMTKVCSEVKKCLPKNTPCGVQILACGNKEALAVSLVCNLDFIRCEGFVFGHVGDEGYTDACAGSLLRYRRLLQADHIMVWSDIKKKHSAHAITQDVSLLETAKAAQFFSTDGIIITGNSTGDPADHNCVQEIKKHCQETPVIVGSGVTENNLEKYFPNSDAVIVGSYFKTGGYWGNDLCEDRVQKFMDKVNYLRNMDK